MMESEGTTAAGMTDAANHHHHDSRFSCNICLEAVTEPVVTQCGHLYCWPCLYRWLEPGMLPGERQSLMGGGGANFYQASSPTYQIDETRRVCPVCKAPCCVPALVPIYVRNRDDGDDTGEERKEGVEVGSSGNDDLGESDADILSVDDSPPDPHPHHDQSQPADESNVDDQRTSSENDRGSWGATRDQQVEAPLSPAGGGSAAVDQPEASAAAGNDGDPTANTGLRQRHLRFRSGDSEIPDSTFNDNNNSGSNATATAATAGAVPARPAANSPVRPTRGNNGNGNNSSPNSPRMATTGGMTALSPHPASLSHALTVSFQQAMRNQGGDGGMNYNHHYVPPLHRREGHGNAALHQQRDMEFENDPDATEFLSRILLLLGSFVILCLLLF